jgi:hypothetical protein
MKYNVKVPFTYLNQKKIYKCTKYVSYIHIHVYKYTYIEIDMYT